MIPIEHGGDTIEYDRKFNLREVSGGFSGEIYLTDVSEEVELKFCGELLQRLKTVEIKRIATEVGAKLIFVTKITDILKISQEIGCTIESLGLTDKQVRS